MFITKEVNRLATITVHIYSAYLYQYDGNSITIIRDYLASDGARQKGWAYPRPIDTENVKTSVSRPAPWRIRPANNLFAISFGGQACLFQSPIVVRREREWCNRYGVGDKNRYTADAIRECKDFRSKPSKEWKKRFQERSGKSVFS